MESDTRLLFGGQEIRLRVCAATDRGKVRPINEDSYLAEGPVFLVADGMGGHAHGDRASSAVVDVFTSRHSGGSATSASNVIASIQAANDAVRALTAADAADLAVAGTTLTGVAILGDDAGGGLSWMAFNVGDSRVYRWQPPVLEQLTVDHSAVQELVDKGEITREEADVHPERNVVTRAVGVDDDAEADIWLIPGGGRQCFVLCSDGLTKELSDERIAELLADSSPAESSVASRLVAAAVASGGGDNVTVVVVDAEWMTEASAVQVDQPAAMPQFLEETAPRR